MSIFGKNCRESAAYHMLCESIANNCNVNEHHISIAKKCTKSAGVKLTDLNISSLAFHVPIAQFFTDAYFQHTLQCNSTINDFMEESKFLSMLSHNGKPFKAIRRHLSEYVKHFSPTVKTVDVEKDNEPSVEIPRKHNMSRILYYTSVIHENIYILNKVCQVDVMFISKILSWVNQTYFEKLGITYEKFNMKQGMTMKQMMRFFNDQLKKKKFKRCVILIMGNKKICEDIIYIWEPLSNNSLSPEIYNDTETEWICNTKSKVLPDLSPSHHNALCLSIHRHLYHNNSISERVYLFHGRYIFRVFKYNLMHILELFCVNKEGHPMIEWQDEINYKEFKDHEYDLFLNIYFADLKLKQPNADIYSNADLFDYNSWIRSLYKCVEKDKHLLLSYMYKASPITIHQRMNIKIGKHYKSMNKIYDNKYIKFIYDNELEDCELIDNLGVNADINDCVLLDFDSNFPVPDQTDMTKDEFIFMFLKQLFL